MTAPVTQLEYRQLIEDLCGALTLTADAELHAKWHRRADCRELVRLR